MADSMRDRDLRSRPRVLIVDDNPSIHRDFELVLLDEGSDADLEAAERRMYGQAARPAILKPGYILDHAVSGLEGIAKVKQALAEARPYQLAFVDIRMPGIDGVETIQGIWQSDPCVQVVICTAFADYSWEDLVRRLGQTDKLLVLKKPFDHIEVMLLASTLTEKWYLARQAALKLGEMELLVARRTQKLLELERREAPGEGLPWAGADGPAPGKEPLVILVVATQAEVRAQISRGFGGDYRVIEAKDGEEGLRQAQEMVPDLIITELVLPGLDGLGLCRRLKQAELTSHIPAIVLTANGAEDWQFKALEAGADECVAKPVALPLLKARVESLLRGRSRTGEHLGPEGSLPPAEITTNQVDAQFLRRTIETAERHLSDFEFDVEAMARTMAVSRRQLFRKLKAVTGSTPHAFLRAMRLKRAAQLLKESQMTVTQITYAVGFSDLKHFRTVFREQFGVLPGEYSARPGHARSD